MEKQIQETRTTKRLRLITVAAVILLSTLMIGSFTEAGHFGPPPQRAWGAQSWNTSLFTATKANFFQKRLILKDSCIDYDHSPHEYMIKWEGASEKPETPPHFSTVVPSKVTYTKNNEKKTVPDSCKGDMLLEQTCDEKGNHHQVGILCNEILEGSKCIINEEGLAACEFYAGNFEDDDNDNVPNYFDNCRLKNSNQIDSDADGLGDDCEVKDMALGHEHSCAIAVSGRIYCWGWNGHKQLGYWTYNYVTSPHSPVAGISSENAQKMSSNRTLNCSVMGNGESVFCWGGGWSNFPALYKPNFNFPAISSKVKKVTLGYSHKCYQLDNDLVECQGDNNHGQLGLGHFLDDILGDIHYDPTVPGEIINGLGPVKDISAGDNHTCAIKNDGQVWCWGGNSGGGLGDNTTEDSATPVQVRNEYGYAIGDMKKITSNGSKTCALRNDGKVWCWGGAYLTSDICSNDIISLNLVDEDKLYASEVDGVTSAIDVAASSRNTCILKDDETVWCWGCGKYGQLGNKSYSNSPTPVQVVTESGDPLTDVVKITIARGARATTHVCALKSDETMWCWGHNYFGQLGIGSTVKKAYAVPVKFGFDN